MSFLIDPVRLALLIYVTSVSNELAAFFTLSAKMSECNMLRAAHRSLECIGNVLQGSLVYLDAGAAEAIQTSIGLKSLIGKI